MAFAQHNQPQLKQG